MKTMKIFLLCLLGMLLAVSVFAGGTQEETEESTGGEAAGVTLKYWDISTADPQKSTIKDNIRQFEEENPGIKINHTATENDPYKTAIRTALAADDPPDIFYVWPGGTYLGMLVEAGVVHPLEDAAERYGWYDRIFTNVLDACKWKGTLYSVSELVAAEPVWYSTAMFNEYGLSEPDTWEKFLNVCETLKGQDIFPIAHGNKNGWPGGHWDSQMSALAAGKELTDKVLLGEEPWNNPDFREGLTKIQELVKAEYFAPGINAMDYAEARTLMYSEAAAMMFMGNWNLATMEEEAPGFEIDYFLLPPWNDKPYTLLSGTSSGRSISKASEHKEEAEQFLNFFLSEEVQKYRQERVGHLPSQHGILDPEEADPRIIRLLEDTESVPGTTAWFNTRMHPELDTVRMKTLQSIFGLDITPEEYLSNIDKRQEELKELGEFF